MDKWKVKIIDLYQIDLSLHFLFAGYFHVESNVNLKCNVSKIELITLLTTHSYPHSSCFLCSGDAAYSCLSPKSNIFDFPLTCHPSANHQISSKVVLESILISATTLAHASSLSLLDQWFRFLPNWSPASGLVAPSRKSTLAKAQIWCHSLLKILPWLPAVLEKNMKLQHSSSSNISLAANLTPPLTAPAVLNFSSQKSSILFFFNPSDMLPLPIIQLSSLG